jgi:hypothetical protein
VEPLFEPLGDLEITAQVLPLKDVHGHRQSTDIPLCVDKA